MRALACALLLGCAGAPPSPACDPVESARSSEAGLRAAPWTLEQHVARHFADGRVSWIMSEAAYQRYVAGPNAARFGRCERAHCVVFVAPAAAIDAAVRASMRDGRHDPAILGRALGLPPERFEGQLRRVTFDFATVATCYRFPLEGDTRMPPCHAEGESECFRFGGFTTGGVPELVLYDVPVAKARVEVIP